MGLGDLLTGIPALRALRATLPQHRVVLGTPAVFEPLVRSAGVVDAVHPASGLDQLHWHGGPPDLAVNLHGSGPESHRLLATLRPGRIIGFGCALASFDGPRWRADEHEVSRWCRLVSETFGVPADPHDVLLPAPAEESLVRAAVVVHPGAAFPARRWPPERFARVAQWASALGLPVVVTGDASEVELARRVLALAGLPPESSLAGRTTLMQLATVVAHARLLVCGDTGVAHLATAYGVPSVVLFGPTPPAHWGPPTSGPHVALWHGDRPRERLGDPFAPVVDAALADITAEEVIGSAEPLLREPAGARSAAS